MQELLGGIRQAIINYEVNKVKILVQQAVDANIDVTIILNEGLIGAMNDLNVKFKNNEVFLPEILASVHSLGAGMEILKPLMAKAGLKEKGTVVIGTVKEDLHDIGKNIVIAMLEGAGYQVIDLGIDVAPEKFAQAIEEYRPQVVGVAALLTTTMMNLGETITLIKAKYPGVKTIIGGAPITQEFADRIGADAYAADGGIAVEKVESFIRGC
jgi:5-methyltetrahydrofolate--homocysteine methyltransferase